MICISTHIRHGRLEVDLSSDSLRIFLCPSDFLGDIYWRVEGLQASDPEDVKNSRPTIR